ncbi:FMN reductase, SsuE family [Nakamurella panacisegetis]|uniref:FMN reductase, SsuE family n=1 Tax=Nakamurella panacisegetis TaxID=1090615 RepID=A0A1H0NJG4_9ACTN|nr:NADPH-dependent FMN reductase [Nakamurella panacisegetis]SDO92834.1 FMN reductase, SsuE family [Nakamurella panacisegetis]
MSKIVTIAGSPSAISSSDALLSHVTRRILRAGHQVTPLVLRDLPAAALLAADATDPAIAGAVQAVDEADAVVIVSPVYKAAYSGLLKVFLDLLPQFGFRGKSVLPLVTGGTPAHVLAVDYALRPVLNSLGSAHIGQGWFVLASHLRVFPDGGVLIDPASAVPVAQVTDHFLAGLTHHVSASSVPVGAGRVSPVPGDPDLTVARVNVGDPELQPLLDDLVIEYGTRYGAVTPHSQLTEVPVTDFDAPHGVFLVLTQNGETIAGGAIRRYDDQTAEVKRVWTSSRHRRRGVARRLMAELEKAAADLGYRRIHLTTGPRQPEARSLYLAAGYHPRFDVNADPETIGPLAFAKELVPGAGFTEWEEPAWDRPGARHGRRVGVSG